MEKPKTAFIAEEKEATVADASVAPSESAELGELFTALAKAQGMLEGAPNNAKNPAFSSSYADLASVVSSTRKALSANGLCVIQRLIDENGQLTLKTRLGHASGQWIEATTRLTPSKPTIWDLGSFITYFRRYSYSAMIGVVTGGEDDDGYKIASKEAKNAVSPVATLDAAQAGLLGSKLEGHGELLDAILEGFGIEKLSQIPQKKYMAVLEKVMNETRGKPGHVLD